MQCNSTAFPPTHGEKGCCFCKLVWITTTFCFVIRSSSLYKASSKCWLSFYTFVMLIIDSFSYAKDQWSATTYAVENHAVPSKVYLLSQITYLFCSFHSLPKNFIAQIYRFVLSLVRNFKVHIFWEGHKNLRNLPLTFDCMYCGQKLVEDFAKFLWPSQNIWTLHKSH